MTGPDIMGTLALKLSTLKLIQKAYYSLYTIHIQLAFEEELTRFQRSLDFYTLLKHGKTCSFLMFKGGIKVEHGLKMS